MADSFDRHWFQRTRDFSLFSKLIKHWFYNKFKQNNSFDRLLWIFFAVFHYFYSPMMSNWWWNFLMNFSLFSATSNLCEQRPNRTVAFTYLWNSGREERIRSPVSLLFSAKLQYECVRLFELSDGDRFFRTISGGCGLLTARFRNEMTYVDIKLNSNTNLSHSTWI